MLHRLLTDFKYFSRKLDFWIAVAAAAVYSSWPLGFLLNPLVAHHDFASELEAAHQPYNWLFIAMDISSGLLLCVLGWRQWRKLGKHILLQLSIVAYVLFGLFVILAAVAPDSCPTGAVCQDTLHNPIIIIHGISSIISVVFLLGSLLLPLHIMLSKRHYRAAILLAIFVLAGWGLTGIGALIVLGHGMRSVWLQYNLISVCSASLVVCAAVIERLGHKGTAEAESTAMAAANEAP